MESRNQIAIDIRDGVKKWESVGNANLPIFNLYYYYPTNCHDVEDYQEWARHFIWNFKDGNNSIEVAEQVITVLKHFFLKETLSSLTLVCIPASTEEKNIERYEKFSNHVCMECDMWNAYEYIELKYDRDARHRGGDEDYENLWFDRNWLKDRTIIIIDDIVTKGGSINNMKRRLEKLSNKVVGAITIGKTVHQDRGEDPYDAMDKSEKRKKVPKRNTSASSSANISAELYERYGNIRRVANERSLAESTVYGHLFSTGTLDPNDYISSSDYTKAANIYDLGYENPSQELDNFLDASGKAAFYFLRRN